jgi:hypothetical protein
MLWPKTIYETDICSKSNAPGTKVVILTYFRPKIEKRTGDFRLNYIHLYVHMQEIFVTLIFKKIANILQKTGENRHLFSENWRKSPTFCRKTSKIAENIDRNIDP